MRIVEMKTNLVCLVLAFWLALGGTGLVSAPPLATTAPGEDSHGDALPSGARLRLGSVRLTPDSICLSAAFSPEGNLLVTSGFDGVIQLWDPRTGKELRRLRGIKGLVYAVAFTPDGKRLAGTGNDYIVHLWDVATGQEVHRLEGHVRRAVALTFDSNSKADVLAIADSDGPVRLWRPGVPDGLRSFALPGAGGSSSVALAPDGKTMAAAAKDNSVRIWDIESGKVLHELSLADARFDKSVVFSPDGKFLVCTGGKQTCLWELASGKKLGPPLEPVGHQCAAVSRPGKVLALGGVDGTVSVWDWSAGNKLSKTRTLGQRYDLRALAFSPDGKTLAAVGGGAVILWDVMMGKPSGVHAGHQEGVASAIYTQQGRTIVTAGWDETVRVWDEQTGAELRRLQLWKSKPTRMGEGIAELRRLAVSADGKLVALGAREGVVIWDVATGKEIYRLPGQCVAFAPDGRLFACGEPARAGAQPPGTIRFYETASGKEWRMLRGRGVPARALVFAADGKTLISRGVWLELLARSRVVDTSEPAAMRVWDVAVGKERAVFPTNMRVFDFQLSSDGRTSITTSYSADNAVLWETATGGKRGELPTGKERVASGLNWVLSVAFSPNGQVVASAHSDHTIKLWDPFTGTKIGQLSGHRGVALSVAFSPDSKTLVSGSADTTALVWDVSRFTQRRRETALTASELKTCWKHLLGDAPIAYRALERLISSPVQTVVFLRKRLNRAPAVKAGRVQQLIAELDSERFNTRDQATRELAGLAEIAVAALRQALAKDSTPEMKRRLELLLDKAENAVPTAETLRQVRAVEALEAIASVNARGLLTELTGGEPEARLTHEARWALRRLQAR